MTETPTIEIKCRTCAAWVKSDEVQGRGECRLTPPVPLVIGAQQVAANGGIVRPGQQAVAMKPILECVSPMTPSEHYCLCWRAKT